MRTANFQAGVGGSQCCCAATFGTSLPEQRSSFTRYACDSCEVGQADFATRLVRLALRDSQRLLKNGAPLLAVQSNER